MLVLLGKISCTINMSEMTCSSRRAEQKNRERQRTNYWLEGEQICRDTLNFSMSKLSHYRYNLTIVNEHYRFMTSSAQFPVPVRSAVKSNLNLKRTRQHPLIFPPA